MVITIAKDKKKGERQMVSVVIQRKMVSEGEGPCKVRGKNPHQGVRVKLGDASWLPDQGSSSYPQT